MSSRNPLSRVGSVILPTRLDGDDIPLWNLLSYKNRGNVRAGFVSLVLLLALLSILFPIYWMVVSAVMPRNEIYSIPTPLIPSEITFVTFRQILLEDQFILWYTNTTIVALGVVVITVITSTLAGYGLTRLDIPYKKYFARSILFGYMFPPILLAIPMFIFWRQIGMINSRVGLIFAEMAITLPFSLWLMWQYFQTVPYSLEESARMEGATRFRAFYDIALPMAKPGMVAVGVFSFAVAWNQFTIPSVLMTDNAKWVLVQGLNGLKTQDQILWNQVMAASALSVIPPFLFVFFLQKYLLEGFSAGDIG